MLKGLGRGRGGGRFGGGGAYGRVSVSEKVFDLALHLRRLLLLCLWGLRGV